jgi:hypothetical protein
MGRNGTRWKKNWMPIADLFGQIEGKKKQREINEET